MSQSFLEYSRAPGNDLITLPPEHDFPGLKSGDRWCLCAARWLEAKQAGVAPPVLLGATHARTLATIELDSLKTNALDPQQGPILADPRDPARRRGPPRDGEGGVRRRRD